MLPTLALAQQAGGHITRPSKAKPKTEKPATPKKQNTIPNNTKKQVVNKSGVKQQAVPDFALNPAWSPTNRSFTVKGVTFTLIAVEGGTFTMGATSEQGNSVYDNEKPVHQVTLSSYYIGETEVTQELWEAVMGNNPSHFKDARKPIEEVSWNDCQVFLHKLNDLTGERFHLPTEAQWEFAARGGNKSKYFKFSGSNTIEDIAWYWGSVPSQFEGAAGYGTQPSATKCCNELGIYDMTGNISEWCYDWKSDYSTRSQTNPAGPNSGNSRIIRGGSWMDTWGFCRVSYRSWSNSDYKSWQVGLRLAL